jgi:hypothetical protein
MERMDTGSAQRTAPAQHQGMAGRRSRKSRCSSSCHLSGQAPIRRHGMRSFWDNHCCNEHPHRRVREGCRHSVASSSSLAANRLWAVFTRCGDSQSKTGSGRRGTPTTEEPRRNLPPFPLDPFRQQWWATGLGSQMESSTQSHGCLHTFLNRQPMAGLWQIHVRSIMEKTLQREVLLPKRVP